ncbi:MAG: TIM barrel protein [Lentisphaeria bacterium]
MLVPGLVSISFRQLPPEAVVPLVVKAGLKAIEWGGDVHVPPGDERRAAAVRRLTADAGLQVAAYGSYYRAGQPAAAGAGFESVLASAVALGAPVVRVWAGAKGSAETPPEPRQALAADLRRIALAAQAAGIRVSLEWHGGTLTDRLESTLELFREVALPPEILGCHWQPHVGQPPPAARRDLEAILPWLTHLHVFHWRIHERLPLAEGAAAWRGYFAAARRTGRGHAALLEFVAHDDPEQFLRDAQALRGLLAEAEG